MILIDTPTQIIIDHSTDWYSLIAIFISPIIPIIITLWYQKKAETKRIKFNTFYILMANRGYLTRNEQFLNALNVIDVVFYKQKDIVAKWHDYKDSLNPKNYQFDVANRKLLDLLKMMATHLGYTGVEQTHIDTPYIPKSYEDAGTRNAMVQDELYNFLKHQNDMNAISRAADDAAKSIEFGK